LARQAVKSSRVSVQQIRGGNGGLNRFAGVRLIVPLLTEPDHFRAAVRCGIPRHAAHVKWIEGPWGERVDPELDSVFNKLESYGLVSKIAPPNNFNIMADYQNRFVLLPKGTRFVALIKSRTAS